MQLFCERETILFFSVKYANRILTSIRWLNTIVVSLRYENVIDVSKRHSNAVYFGINFGNTYIVGKRCCVYVFVSKGYAIIIVVDISHSDELVVRSIYKTSKHNCC